MCSDTASRLNVFDGLAEFAGSFALYFICNVDVARGDKQLKTG